MDVVRHHDEPAYEPSLTCCRFRPCVAKQVYNVAPVQQSGPLPSTGREEKQRIGRERGDVRKVHTNVGNDLPLKTSTNVGGVTSPRSDMVWSVGGALRDGHKCRWGDLTPLHMIAEIR